MLSILLPFVSAVLLLMSAIFYKSDAVADDYMFVAEPFPPFSYMADNHVAGPNADVLRAVCARMAVSCRIELMRWQRAYALAEVGERDGIILLAQTPERDRHFYFSPPVVSTGYALFVLEDNGLLVSPGRLEELKGHRVVAYGPSNTYRTLKEIAAKVGGLEIFSTGQNESALRMVRLGRFGRLGAALVNRDVGQYLIHKHHLSGLRVAGFVTTVDYRFGFSRKAVSPDQVQAFSTMLKSLYAEGEVARILEAHSVGLPSREAMGLEEVRP